MGEFKTLCCLKLGPCLIIFKWRFEHSLVNNVFSSGPASNTDGHGTPCQDPTWPWARPRVWSHMRLILLHQLRCVSARHYWYPTDGCHCDKQRPPGSWSRLTLFWSLFCGFCIWSMWSHWSYHALSRSTKGCTPAGPVRCLWIASDIRNWWKGAVSGVGHHYEEVCISNQDIGSK